MHRKALLILFLLSAVTGFLRSQTNATLPNVTATYDPAIRTIRFSREAEPFSMPVYELNSGKKLVFDFDDLYDGLRRFRYTIRHCNSEWKTSEDITSFDYISGFDEVNIEKFTYSYNTTRPYIHYSAVFPDDNLRPKFSGNYLLIVFDDTPDQVVFTLRFLVVENMQVAISANVAQAGKIDLRNTHQQVDAVVNLKGWKVNDIGREIRTVILQNQRWDNAVTISRPRFVRGDELDYRYDENIVFRGGNQFRNFDFRSLVYQSDRVAVMGFDTANQVYLLPDQPRTYKPYVSEPDLNGNFLIKSDDHARDSDIESDYAWVHFFLPFPVTLTTGSLHVLGNFSLWQTGTANQLAYNPGRRGYELSVLLKQGYYNYLYALKNPADGSVDVSFIEGSHWETENDYSVLVYFAGTGERYERLIGVLEGVRR